MARKNVVRTSKQLFKNRSKMDIMSLLSIAYCIKIEPKNDDKSRRMSVYWYNEYQNCQGHQKSKLNNGPNWKPRAALASNVKYVCSTYSGTACAPKKVTTRSTGGNS